MAVAVWDTSRPDWEARIIAGQSILPDLPLDTARAEKALRIFKRLRIKDIPGYPTMGEACPVWVFDWVYLIFGARDAQTKRQVVSRFLLMISKKNGKSTIAAGVMMTALILNDRADGEFTILAPTKEIANNSFGPAMGMVQLDPDLSDLFKANRNYRTIEHRLLGSSLRVVAADADTVGGGKSIATLIDELWLFGKSANFANILSEIEGALMSRPEGFVAFLTTQSNEEPAGEFKRILGHMRDVRDGKVIDPTSVAAIYEFPSRLIQSDDWMKDEALYRIPNPSLGYSARMEFLRTGLATKCDTPEAKNLFLAKHFNIEVGLRQRTNSWAGAAFWLRRADRTLTLDELIERCDVAVVGVDGGGLDDLLGLCVIGREKGTRRWLVWCKAWARRIVLERRKEIASKLIDLDRTEWFEIVDDDSTKDVEDLADIVVKVRDAGLLPAQAAIGADPAGVNDIVDELERRGFSVGKEGEIGEIISVTQGYRLQSAVKVAERRLAQGNMIHDGSDLMAWCVGNAKVEQKGNALMVTKQISGTGKIDPVMAMFNAVTLMSMNPEASRSVFDQMAEGDENAGEGASDDAIDEAILRDPTHPRWQEMRERYEAALADADEDVF